jgi:DNA repair exonuclease SbcCD nuclease subunit
MKNRPTRIANLADLHARGRDLKAFRAQWEQALRVCMDEKVSRVLIVGDIFNTSDVYDSAASTGAIADAVLSPLNAFHRDQPGTEVVALVGNHDLQGMGSVDALAILPDWVTVRREHGWISRPGLDLLCIPWDWSGADAEKVIADLARAPRQEGQARALLAHIQVKGAMTGEGATYQKKPHWGVSREFLQGLDFDRFILGDFHRRQELVEGRGGYIGALRQMGHGEEGNPAGLEIWTPETGEARWVELNAAPQYRTVDLYEPTEELPAPAKGEALRVRTIGWRPSNAAARVIEEQGAAVVGVLEYEERESRAEVEPGTEQNPLALLRLWAAEQIPAVEGEELAYLEERLREELGDFAGDLLYPVASNSKLSEQEAAASRENPEYMEESA